MFSRVKPNKTTSSDLKLEKIKGILFPPLLFKEVKSANGESAKYHLDYSADSNLDAALMDLQSGQNDLATQRTINRVIDSLIKVRKILEVHQEFNSEAQYLIVDTLEDDIDVTARDS